MVINFFDTYLVYRRIHVVNCYLALTVRFLVIFTHLPVFSFRTFPSGHSLTVFVFLVGFGGKTGTCIGVGSLGGGGGGGVGSLCGR